jgi:hypothetical protein
MGIAEGRGEATGRRQRVCGTEMYFSSYQQALALILCLPPLLLFLLLLLLLLLRV